MQATAVKERPILFSGPMVQAILSGRKTQTRRVIDPQPSEETGGYWCCVSSTERSSVGKWTPRKFRKTPRDGSDNPATGESIKCRYGDVGDRLWVRETWSPMPGNRPIPNPEIYDSKPAWYRADNDRPMWAGGKWHPSIHMPRKMSRITLEITGIRVERLNEISEENAKAEGVEPTVPIYGDSGGYVHEGGKEAFMKLWESINGPDSWTANPWVWVVEFKKLETP